MEHKRPSGTVEGAKSSDKAVSRSERGGSERKGKVEESLVKRLPTEKKCLRGLSVTTEKKNLGHDHVLVVWEGIIVCNSFFLMERSSSKRRRNRGFKKERESAYPPPDRSRKRRRARVKEGAGGLRRSLIRVATHKSRVGSISKNVVGSPVR